MVLVKESCYMAILAGFVGCRCRQFWRQNVVSGDMSATCRHVLYHMVAVLKVGAISSLTRVAIMPYRFAKEQWRAQFPENERCALHITLATIKAKSQPVDNIRYCPAWTAGQKKGHPKKEQRHLGITDHIQNASKKRKRGRRSVGSTERDAKLQSILEDEEAANVLDNLRPVEGQDEKEGEIVGKIGCA